MGDLAPINIQVGSQARKLHESQNPNMKNAVENHSTAFF